MSLQNLKLKDLEDYDFVLEMALNDDDDKNAPDFLELSEQMQFEYLLKITHFSETGVGYERELQNILKRSKGELKRAKRMLYAIVKQNS